MKLTARAFYDDISMKGDNQPKTSRGDNRGMAVVVLDALTRYLNLCPNWRNLHPNSYVLLGSGKFELLARITFTETMVVIVQTAVPSPLMVSVEVLVHINPKVVTEVARWVDNQL